VTIFNLLINDLKRNKEAFEYCLKAAERGVLDAQNKLYKLYLYGHGCVRDEEKAKRWYLRTKKFEKSSNVETDNDFEKENKIGKELCEFEEKSLIENDGLTIMERVERKLMKTNDENVKINKLFEYFQKMASFQPKPIFQFKNNLEISDLLPQLREKAINGSSTAQNYLISLEMYMEADKLILEKKYEQAFHILRESIKYNDAPKIFDYEKIEQALELIDKNNIDGKYIKARTLGNDFKGCISFLQRCIKHHSNEADFHHLLGCMYAFSNNYGKALNQFERALELEYRRDWLYEKATAMRFFYSKKEDSIKIVEAYKIFLDSNPPDHRKVPEALFSMALCYLGNKDYSTARVYWEKANDSVLDRLPCFEPVGDHFCPKATLDLFFLTDIVNNPKFCSHCGKESPKLKCFCKNTFYCDPNCQKLNWIHHKNECNMKKL